MTQTILFWNCNVAKGRLMLLLEEPEKAAVVARLVARHRADVLILAECEIPSDVLVAALGDLEQWFDGPLVPHERIRFFLRRSELHLEPIWSDDRLLVHRLSKDRCEDVLISAIHFYGRRDKPEERSRHAMVERHHLQLRKAERAAGHRRVALVGDFNMNPFEMGMIDPENGFGAMMTWDLAEIHSRGGLDVESRFYNPMWSLMGRPGTPGTYYWDSNDSYNIHWHCLDGVLVRPDLRGVFLDESLAIVDSIPGEDGRDVSLIRLAQKHWRIEYSDHLPILFQMEMRPGNTEDFDG